MGHLTLQCFCVAGGRGVFTQNTVRFNNKAGVVVRTSAQASLVCMCVCVCVCMYAYTSAQASLVCVYVCVYVCMYTYTLAQASLVYSSTRDNTLSLSYGVYYIHTYTYV